MIAGLPNVMHWGATLIVPKVSAAWRHAFDDVTPDAAPHPACFASRPPHKGEV